MIAVATTHTMLAKRTITIVDEVKSTHMVWTAEIHLKLQQFIDMFPKLSSDSK